MSPHPLAGKPAPKDLLIDVNWIEEAFYVSKPDPTDLNQLVSFGTSGHRGTSSNATFTGLILSLLAAEITERTGKDPGMHYQELTAEFGTPYYTRIDAPATPEQKNLLKKLSPEAVTATELAGEPITAKLTRAPGNDAPIGGLKVVSASGWFAARPSGTENIYKLYAESLKSAEHLTAIVEQAQEIVSRSLGGK